MSEVVGRLADTEGSRQSSKTDNFLKIFSAFLDKELDFMIEWIVLTLPHAQWKWKFPFIIFWWLPWEVDGGEDHHAGDVDGVDHVVLGVPGDVVGGLVDHVHEDGGKVGLHEDAGDLPRQDHGDFGHVPTSFLIQFMADSPVVNNVLRRDVSVFSCQCWSGLFLVA